MQQLCLNGIFGLLAMLTFLGAQLMMPMLQGVVYNLAWCGWQHWNKNAQLSGNSWGAKARRWWYGVNKWRIDGRSNNWQQKDWYQRR